MYKGKGISFDGIVETAKQLMMEKGYGKFSTRDVAERLGVRVSSLYHYINSMEEINQTIGTYAAVQLNGALKEAIRDKERDGALEALAYAYRDFVESEPELYKAILGLPQLSENDELREVGKESFQPIRTVVEQYGVARVPGLHFARCFRGALHGFVTLQGDGYFTNKDAGAEESFRFLIKGYADWLRRLGEGKINDDFENINEQE